jgi:phosphomannomutase
MLQDPGYVLQQALTSHSSPSSWQLLQQYGGHLRQQLVEAINHPQHREQPLKGLKIVVDAGNGSGGFFASQVGGAGLVDRGTG